MAISTADRFEYDVPTQATAMGIPPSILKVVIRKLFGFATQGIVPDKLHFVEQAKAFANNKDRDGNVLAVHASTRLLLNSEDTMTIGLRPGEGTDLATLQAYIDKAAPMVSDLSAWKA
jgi:hypothetical protein